MEQDGVLHGMRGVMFHVEHRVHEQGDIPTPSDPDREQMASSFIGLRIAVKKIRL